MIAIGDSPLYTDEKSERATLGCLFKYGIDAYIECKNFGLSPSDFFYKTNGVVFHAVTSIFETNPVAKLDEYIVFVKITELGFKREASIIEKEGLLKTLLSLPVQLSNCSDFALNVKKNSCFRDSLDRVDSLKESIKSGISGKSSMEDLLPIVDRGCAEITGSIINPNAKFTVVGEDVDEILQNFEERGHEIIGVPSGFPLYDSCIGGGLRRGAVNLIGARSGKGKSFIANTICRNVSARGVPVLYGDTEMQRAYQLTRLLSMCSGVKINDIESGRFKNNPEDKGKIHKAKDYVQKLPFYHEYIGGWAIEQFIAYCKKWMMKSVKPDGDSVIILDYLKLMNSEDLKFMQEFQLLGLWATMLHDFATQYQTTIVMFVQLNRAGIDLENDAAISGSDRINHLCSSFSIFKEKKEEELGETGEFGNNKWIVAKSRYGSVTPSGDYINIFTDLSRATIKEGVLASTARSTQRQERNDQDGEE